MKKTVLVTGASQGFGKLISKKFHKEGWNVIATMRTPDKEEELTQFENILVSHLDVTNKSSIKSAVSEGVKRFNRIDVLVNNAGFGLQGPFMTIPNDSIRKQMEVNLFGLFDVTRAVLPYMEKQKEGVIVNISSIGGLVAFPFTSMYHASKYAVEGFTEALQYELNPIGIKLKLIEPGSFSTGFISAMDKETSDFPKTCIYRPGYEATVLKRKSNMSAGQDPQEVANITYLAATDGEDTLRYMVGEDAKGIYESRKKMSDIAFKNMIAEAFKL